MISTLILLWIIAYAGALVAFDRGPLSVSGIFVRSDRFQRKAYFSATGQSATYRFGDYNNRPIQLEDRRNSLDVRL